MALINPAADIYQGRASVLELRKVGADGVTTTETIPLASLSTEYCQLTRTTRLVATYLEEHVAPAEEVVPETPKTEEPRKRVVRTRHA
jgi:hypothetical protein